MRLLRCPRFAATAASLLILGLSGCGGGGIASFVGGNGNGSRGTSAALTMLSFADQWPSARPRWLDIANDPMVPYSSTFIASYPGSPGTIEVRYETETAESYFVGEITGSGLKPNFCYQLKLVGKPKGRGQTGLWPSGSDATTNEALLRGGRWWNYKTEEAAFTTTNDTSALRSTDYRDGWVAGYTYFGFVLTDAAGDIVAFDNGTGAPVTDTDDDGWIAITANRSYHVTWNSDQRTAFDGGPNTYLFSRSSTYGYSADESGLSMGLGFEKESDDPVDFALADGTHDVVLMVTEESFHTGGATGGVWLTAWVSDWSTGTSPRTGQRWISTPGTPIRFTTGVASGGGGETQTLSATVTVSISKRGKRIGAAAEVRVTDAAGQPVSGATVTGDWSGAYTATGQSASTDSTGVATFSTPTGSAASGDAFTFAVTNVSATGGAWDGVAASDTAVVP